MKISTGVTVNVSANTERWLSELRAGRCFGGTGSIASVAAQNAHVQIFNPIASGITVLVRNLWADPFTASTIVVTHYNTALANLSTTTVNLLSGGAAPVAEIRAANNAGLLGSIFFGQAFPPSLVQQVAADWVTELGPGEGLTFALVTVNIALEVSFQWNEV